MAELAGFRSFSGTPVLQQQAVAHQTRVLGGVGHRDARGAHGRYLLVTVTVLVAVPSLACTVRVYRAPAKLAKDNPPP